MNGKKKLVVPLVAIMMCAVALAGVAYAYTASLSIPDQKADAADLTIDLATGAPATDIVEAKGVITFTDNYVYTGLNPATKTDRVDAYAKADKTTYALKVTGEATAAKIVIKSADIATWLNTTIGNNVKISDLVQVKVNIADDVNSAVALSSAGAAFTITKVANTDLPVTVYLFFVPVDANAHTVQPATATTAQGFKDAAAFKPVVENVTFSISFEADSEAIAP